MLRSLFSPQQESLQTGSRWLTTACWKAFWLALRNKPLRYEVTPKSKVPWERWRLMPPHGSVAFLTALAWGIGVFTGNVRNGRNGSIHVVAALIVLLSLTLILTEAVHGYS